MWRLLRSFVGLSLSREVFLCFRGSGIGVLFSGLELRQLVICRLEAPFGVILRSRESGQLVASPKTISVLQMRYAKLRSQALTPEDSRSLLERMRGAL